MKPIQTITLYWIKALSFLLTLTLLVVSGCSLLMSQPPSANALKYSNSQTTMAVLHIALQDGFMNDEVIIHVNGKEVFHQSGIKTRFQISFATSFEIDVPQGAVEVSVNIPSRNQTQSTVLDVSNPTYLGVSVTAEANIEFRISTEPFGYL
jgi:hypothetical protein